MMQNEITPNSRLRLPVQAAPVHRALTPGALGGGPGVEAAAWWNDLEDFAKKAAQYAPVAIDVAKSVAQAF